MEECLSGLEGVRIVSYADDTTVYVCADGAEEVYDKLTEAAERILEFMRWSGLAANTDKTCFVTFNAGMDRPITVGKALVEVSKEEKMVGVWLSGNLSWEKNLEEQELALRRRIGVLRRLSWHLPRKTMIKCITPVFTSKLAFGLELMADPLMHHDQNQPKCSVIVRLQRLLNEAVRAALRLGRSDKISEKELMTQSGQSLVVDLAERAIANQAWNALATEERRNSSELARRVEWGQRSRVTRQNQQDLIPPQSISNSLIPRICRLWNIMPEDIKSESSKVVAKNKLKFLFDKV